MTTLHLKPRSVITLAAECLFRLAVEFLRNLTSCFSEEQWVVLLQTVLPPPHAQFVPAADTLQIVFLWKLQVSDGQDEDKALKGLTCKVK